MKKFIYLMAMVCTLGFFTACSSDDDDNDKDFFVRNEKIEGTWGLQEVEKIELDGGKGEFYKGSVKLTWDCPEGTTLNIKIGDNEIPMDVNQMIIPMINNVSNQYLPQILKNVTFTKDGKINATYSELPEEGETSDWKTAEGYASYTVANDNLIYVTIDANKATEDIDDAAEKAQIKGILQQYNKIPVNIRWNGTKPYFFVDKAFVQPMIANLVAMLEKVPTKDMDADDLQLFNMLKGIMGQLPEIMNKTTKFELGLELMK